MVQGQFVVLFTCASQKSFEILVGCPSISKLFGVQRLTNMHVWQHQRGIHDAISPHHDNDLTSCVCLCLQEERQEEKNQSCVE